LKYERNATKTLIVESLKFVAKVTVWMLANKSNAESMRNVNTLYMMLDVNVFQALLVMRLESAFHVSKSPRFQNRTLFVLMCSFAL